MMSRSLMRSVVLAILTFSLAGCASVASKPDAVHESPLLTISETISIIRVRVDGTVEMADADGAVQRRHLNRWRMSRLQQLLSAGPTVMGGYLSYVPPIFPRRKWTSCSRTNPIDT